MKDLIRFIKFSLVGAVNTGITMGIYTLLVYINLHVLFAYVIGYSAGVANSYFWNSRWVFKPGDNSRGEKEINTAAKFIVVNLIVLILSSSVLYILVDVMGGNKYLSQLPVVAVSMVLNYILNKIWTFKHRVYA
jgi:putative flippase GtrA